MPDIVQEAIDDLLPAVRSQIEASFRRMSIPELQVKNRQLGEELNKARQDLSTEAAQQRALALMIESKLLDEEVSRRGY